jgi:hypothetical protein
MSPHATRWLRNRAFLGATALAIAIVFVRVPTLDREDAALLSGWLLVVAVLMLVLFNVRKKLPFIPLLTAATWLQFHAYVGVFAAVIFMLHTQGRYPDGVFDRVLWFFFVLVALSGFFGLWLSRVLPHRMRSRGEAVLFERIPVYRARLAAEVEALAARSVKESGSPVIAELYSARIRRFLAGNGSTIGHIFESRRALNGLRRDMRAIERYLPPAGRESLAAIDERLIAKDGLDYQHAIHSLMKGWLFVHIPLAYGILPLIAIHIVLFYAFGRI